LVLNKVISSKQIRERLSKLPQDLVVMQVESILDQSTHSGEILFKPNISFPLEIGQLRYGLMSLSSQLCKPDITLLILQTVAGHHRDVVSSI